MFLLLRFLHRYKDSDKSRNTTARNKSESSRKRKWIYAGTDPPEGFFDKKGLLVLIREDQPSVKQDRTLKEATTMLKRGRKHYQLIRGRGQRDVADTDVRGAALPRAAQGHRAAA